MQLYDLIQGYHDLCWILHWDAGLQPPEPDQADDGVTECRKQTACERLLSIKPHAYQWQVRCVGTKYQYLMQIQVIKLLDEVCSFNQ